MRKTTQRPEKKPIYETVKMPTESKSDTNNGQKSWYIEGIAAQANVRNGNGRIYPHKVLREAVGKYKNNFIDKKISLGELGHPDGKTRPDDQINYDYVSHLILSLEEKGNDYHSKSKILRNPIGLNFVIPLLEENIPVAFSTRGFGESQFSQAENSEIITEYELLTVDIVHIPSAPGAVQTGMMEQANKYSKLLTEAKTMDLKVMSEKAKEIKLYDESYKFFCELNEEEKFFSIMDSYNYNYEAFYKDLFTLQNLLIQGKI
jgi:hypothetical protein